MKSVEIVRNYIITGYALDIQKEKNEKSLFSYTI